MMRCLVSSAASTRLVFVACRCISTRVFTLSAVGCIRSSRLIRTRLPFSMAQPSFPLQTRCRTSNARMLGAEPRRWHVVPTLRRRKRRKRMGKSTTMTSP